MSTSASGPVDHDYLGEELRRAFPASVQQLLMEYSSFRSVDGLVEVLSSDLASYFSLEHPRVPGGESRGVGGEDNARMLSRNLPPAELARAIVDVHPSQLLADFRVDDDAIEVAEQFDYPGSIELRSDQIVRCIEALPEWAVAAVIVDDWAISGEEGRGIRNRLLKSLHHVSELFDCGGYWYMAWVPKDEDADGPSPTQVARIPSVDEWPEFRAGSMLASGCEALVRCEPTPSGKGGDLSSTFPPTRLYASLKARRW